MNLKDYAKLTSATGSAAEELVKKPSYFDEKELIRREWGNLAFGLIGPIYFLMAELQ
jgi:hypothetical protein